MNKLFGSLFIIVGLSMIGIGSYNEFETIRKKLIGNNKQNSYNSGLYVASGDSILVTQDKEDIISVVLNNKKYEFKYNGDYFEDIESGFYIIFENDELNLYKDGEVIKKMQKEK